MSQDAAEALFGLVALCQHLPHNACEGTEKGGGGGGDVEPSATLHSSLDVTQEHAADEDAARTKHPPELSSMHDAVDRVRDMERVFLRHLARVELSVSQLPCEAETAADVAQGQHASSPSATPSRDCGLTSPAQVRAASHVSPTSRDNRRGAARRLAAEYSPQKAKQWFDQYTHKLTTPTSAATPVRTAMHGDIQDKLNETAESEAPAKTYRAASLSALAKDNEVKQRKAGTVRTCTRQEEDEALSSWSACMMQQALLYDALHGFSQGSKEDDGTAASQNSEAPHYVSPFALPATPHTTSQTATQGSQAEAQRVLGALEHRTWCAHFVPSSKAGTESEEEEEGSSKSTGSLPDAADSHGTSHSPFVLPSLLRLRTGRCHEGQQQPSLHNVLQCGLLEALTTSHFASVDETQGTALQGVMDRLLRLQTSPTGNSDDVLTSPHVVGVVRRFTHEADEGTESDGLVVRLVPASEWATTAASATDANREDDGSNSNAEGAVMRFNALLIEVTSRNASSPCDKDEAALWDCLVQVTHFAYVIGTKAEVTQTASHVAAALRHRRQARQRSVLEAASTSLITATIPTSLFAFFFSLVPVPSQDDTVVQHTVDKGTTLPCSVESAQDDVEQWFVKELMPHFRESNTMSSATREATAQDESSLSLSAAPRHRRGTTRHGSVLLCRVQQLVPGMYVTRDEEEEDTLGETSVVCYASAVRYILLRQLFFAAKQQRSDELHVKQPGSPMSEQSEPRSTPRAHVAFNETPLSISTHSLPNDDNGSDDESVGSPAESKATPCETETRSCGGNVVRNTSTAARHEVIITGGHRTVYEGTVSSRSVAISAPPDTSPLTLTSPRPSSIAMTSSNMKCDEELLRTIDTPRAAPRSILKSSARYKAAKLIRAGSPAVSVVPFCSTTLWRCWLAELTQKKEANDDTRGNALPTLRFAVRDTLCVTLDRYVQAVEQYSVWLAAETGVALVVGLVGAERSLAERVLGVPAARFAPGNVTSPRAGRDAADTAHESLTTNETEHMGMAEVERVMAYVMRCVVRQAFAALVDTNTAEEEGNTGQSSHTTSLPLVVQLRLRVKFHRSLANAQLQLGSHLTRMRDAVCRLTRALAELALTRLCRPLQRHMLQASHVKSKDAAAETTAEEEDAGTHTHSDPKVNNEDGDDSVSAALCDVRRVLELCDALGQQYASCLLLPCPFYTSHMDQVRHTPGFFSATSPSSPPPLLLVSPDSVLLSVSTSHPASLRCSFHPLSYCKRNRDAESQPAGAQPWSASPSRGKEQGASPMGMKCEGRDNTSAAAQAYEEEENGAMPPMRRAVSTSLLRNTMRASGTWNLPQQWLIGPATFMASFTISERDLRAMSQRTLSTGGESAWSASLPRANTNNENDNNNNDGECNATGEACSAMNAEQHGVDETSGSSARAKWCGIRESALLRPYTTRLKQELLAAFFVTTVLPYLWQRVSSTLPNNMPCESDAVVNEKTAGIGPKKKSLATLVSDGPNCDENGEEEPKRKGDEGAMTSTSTPADVVLHSTELVRETPPQTTEEAVQEKHILQVEEPQQESDVAAETPSTTWTSCVQQIQHTLQEVLLLRDQLRRDQLKLSELSHTRCNEVQSSAAAVVMTGTCQKPGNESKTDTEATMCEILRLMRSLVAKVPSSYTGNDVTTDKNGGTCANEGEAAESTATRSMSRGRRRRHDHHQQQQQQQVLDMEMHTSELISLPGFLGVEHEFSQDDALATSEQGGAAHGGHIRHAGAALGRSPSTTAHNTSYSVVASEVYSPLALPQRSGTTTYTVASVSTMASFTPIAARTAALMQQSTSEMGAFNAITYVDGPLHVGTSKRAVGPNTAAAASMSNGPFVLHHYGNNNNGTAGANSAAMQTRDDSALTTPRDDGLEKSCRRTGPYVNRVGSFLSLAKTPCATLNDAATQTNSLEALVQAYMADHATQLRLATLGSGRRRLTAALSDSKVNGVEAAALEEDDEDDEDMLQPASPTLLETLPYAPTVAPTHSTCLAGGSQSSYASSSCLSAPTMQAYSHFVLNEAIPTAAVTMLTTTTNKPSTSPSASTLHRSNALANTQPPDTPGEDATTPTTTTTTIASMAHTPQQPTIQIENEKDIEATSAVEVNEDATVSEVAPSQQLDAELTLPRPTHVATETPQQGLHSETPHRYTPYGYVASAEPTPHDDTHRRTNTEVNTQEHASSTQTNTAANQTTQSPSRGIGADLNAAATNATVYASVKALQTAFLSTTPAHHDAAVAALAELQGCLSRTTQALHAMEQRCSRAETALVEREQTICDLQGQLATSKETQQRTCEAESAHSIGMQTESPVTHTNSVTRATQSAVATADAEGQTAGMPPATSREGSQHAALVAHLQSRLALTNVHPTYSPRRSRSAICASLRLRSEPYDETRAIQRAHITELQATLSDTARLLEEERRRASEWRTRSTQHELRLQQQLARRETQVQALQKERDELRVDLDTAQAELRARRKEEEEAAQETMQQAHTTAHSDDNEEDDSSRKGDKESRADVEELVQLRASVEEAKAALDTAERSSESQREAWAVERVEHTTRAHALETRLAEVQAELAKERTATEVLQGQYTQLQTLWQAVTSNKETQVTTLLAHANDLQAQLARRETQVQALQKERDELRVDLDTAQAELHARRKEEEEAAQETMQQAHTTAHSDDNEEDDSSRKGDKESRADVEELVQLRASVEEAKAALGTAERSSESQREAWAVERAEHTNRAHALETRLAEVQAELAKERTATEVLQGQYTQLQTLWQAVTSNKETQVTTLLAHANDLQAQLARRETQVQALQKERDELRVDLDTAQAELHARRKEEEEAAQATVQQAHATVHSDDNEEDDSSRRSHKGDKESRADVEELVQLRASVEEAKAALSEAKAALGTAERGSESQREAWAVERAEHTTRAHALETRLAEVQAELAKERTATEVLQGQYTQLQTLWQAVTSNKETQVTTLLAHANDLQAQLARRETQVQALQKERDELRVDLDTAQAELHARRKEEEAAQETVQQAHTTAHSDDNEEDDSSRRSHKGDKESRADVEELVQLRASVEEAKAALSEAKAALGTAERGSESQREAWAVERAEHTTRAHALETRLAEVQAELAKERTATEVLQGQYTQLQTLWQAVTSNKETQVTTLLAHANDLQAQLARRETQVQALQKERDELRVDLDTAQAELHARRKEEEAAQETVQQAHTTAHSDDNEKDDSSRRSHKGDKESRAEEHSKQNKQQKHAKSSRRLTATSHSSLIDDSLGLHYELQLKERRIAALQECVRQLQQTRSTDAETIRRLQHLLHVQQEQEQFISTTGLSPLPTSVVVLSNATTRPPINHIHADVLASGSNNNVRLSRSAELASDIQRLTASPYTGVHRNMTTSETRELRNRAVMASRRLSWPEDSASVARTSKTTHQLSSTCQGHTSSSALPSAACVPRPVRAHSCDDATGRSTSPSQGGAGTNTTMYVEKSNVHTAAAVPMSPEKYREEYAALSVSLSRLQQSGK